jgi:hypothetical protein
MCMSPFKLLHQEFQNGYWSGLFTQELTRSSMAHSWIAFVAIGVFGLVGVQSNSVFFE